MADEASPESLESPAPSAMASRAGVERGVREHGRVACGIQRRVGRAVDRGDAPVGAVERRARVFVDHSVDGRVVPTIARVASARVRLRLELVLIVEEGALEGRREVRLDAHVDAEPERRRGAPPGCSSPAERRRSRVGIVTASGTPGGRAFGRAQRRRSRWEPGSSTRRRRQETHERREPSGLASELGRAEAHGQESVALSLRRRSIPARLADEPSFDP